MFQVAVCIGLYAIKSKLITKVKVAARKPVECNIISKGAPEVIMQHPESFYEQ